MRPIMSITFIRRRVRWISRIAYRGFLVNGRLDFRLCHPFGLIVLLRLRLHEQVVVPLLLATAPGSALRLLRRLVDLEQRVPVVIALLGGSTAEIDLNALMRRRLTLTGSTLRPQSVEAKGMIAAALRRHIWPHLESGAIRPVIDSTFPLAEAAKAHARMESGAHIGNIVLTV